MNCGIVDHNKWKELLTFYYWSRCLPTTSLQILGNLFHLYQCCKISHILYLKFKLWQWISRARHVEVTYKQTLIIWFYLTKLFDYNGKSLVYYHKCLHIFLRRSSMWSRICSRNLQNRRCQVTEKPSGRLDPQHTCYNVWN